MRFATGCQYSIYTFQKLYSDMRHNSTVSGDRFRNGRFFCWCCWTTLALIVHHHFSLPTSCWWVPYKLNWSKMYVFLSLCRHVRLGHCHQQLCFVSQNITKVTVTLQPKIIIWFICETYICSKVRDRGYKNGIHSNMRVLYKCESAVNEERDRMWMLFVFFFFCSCSPRLCGGKQNGENNYNNTIHMSCNEQCCATAYTRSFFYVVRVEISVFASYFTIYTGN